MGQPEYVKPGSAEWRAKLEALIEGATAEDLLEALAGPLARLGLQAPTVLDERPTSYVKPRLKPKAPKTSHVPAVESDSTALDKAQFLMSTYYAQEGDKCATVHVVRLGKREVPASVHFATEQGSAQPGKNYVERSGVLEFAPGETEKEITIPLINDDSWHATVELTVELSEANGLELAKHLNQARVKIIDNDVFPSNRYAKELLRPGSPGNLPANFGHEAGLASHWGVMKEYFKMNFRSRVVRAGTIKCLIADQLLNMVSIAGLVVSQYLTDDVLVKYTAEGLSADVLEYMIALLAVALLRLLFAAITHFLAYRRCFWKVGGASRKFLQSNLLRRNLAYSPESHALVPTSLLTQSTNAEVDQLVNHGYLQIFPIAKGIGLVVFLALFQTIRLGFLGAAQLFLFPLCMLAFVQCRDRKTNHVLRASNGAETELVDHVIRCSENVRLLTDFSKRSHAVKRFQVTVGQHNSALVQSAAVQVNNKVFPVWMVQLLVAVFTLCGGYYTISGDPSWSFLMRNPSLGTFQAIISVLGSLGDCFEGMYSALLLMMEAFPALEKIVTLLNLTTEDGDRMRLCKDTLEAGRKAWREAQKREFSEEFQAYLKERHITRALDTIPLKLQGATFQYPNLEWRFDAEIRQGQLVGVIGPGQAHGRCTFLKLLAGVLCPSEGSVFMAPHLRLLHVCATPLFFNRRNLLQNICLGLPDSEHEAAIGRVKDILQSMGFGEKILSRLAVNDSPASWSSILSSQQCQLLNLARALVASPEVLVAHSPLLPFDQSMRHNVLNILRAFVDRRGYMEDERRFMLRHPRTCVFSFADAKHKEEIDMLDRVMIVRDGSVINKSHDEAAEHFGLAAPSSPCMFMSL